MIKPGDYITHTNEGKDLYVVVRELCNGDIRPDKMVTWRNKQFEIHRIDTFATHNRLRKEWGFSRLDNIGFSIGVLR